MRDDFTASHAAIFSKETARIRRREGKTRLDSPKKRSRLISRTDPAETKRQIEEGVRPSKGGKLDLPLEVFARLLKRPDRERRPRRDSVHPGFVGFARQKLRRQDESSVRINSDSLLGEAMIETALKSLRRRPGRRR